MNELLIRHPKKYDDESHEGYVIRISILNFAPQKYFEINKLKEYSQEVNFQKYLNHLTRLTGHEFNQETISVCMIRLKEERQSEKGYNMSEVMKLIKVGETKMWRMVNEAILVPDQYSNYEGW